MLGTLPAAFTLSDPSLTMLPLNVKVDAIVTTASPTAPTRLMFFQFSFLFAISLPSLGWVDEPFLVTSFSVTIFLLHNSLKLKTQ